jgi:hypothetical protein
MRTAIVLEAGIRIDLEESGFAQRERLFSRYNREGEEQR